MKSLIIILFIPIIALGQKSIQKSDIEIHTQLTLLSVDSIDALEFEASMNSLSKLARRAKLKEDYDWLVYKTDSDQYLIVNFSNGIKDVLTLKDYRIEFQNQKVGIEFEKAVESIKHLGITSDRNYIKQMVLPWSTVEQISVSEFPLAEMIEYKIKANKIDVFDKEIRKLVGILKETKYPYPLEGNRGSLGAYSTMTLVWFYNDIIEFKGVKSIDNWMEKQNRKKEVQKIIKNINGISESKKVHTLTYKKKLSY
jgi:hypothetical protein